MNLDTYYDKFSGCNLIIRPDAYVLSNVFDQDYFYKLKSYLLRIKDENYNFTYDIGFGRTTHHSYSADPDAIFAQSHDKLVPLARELFNNPNIEKSYCIYSVYKGHKARLFKHIDDNACTYTIDLAVHYEDLWPIFVEGKELIAEENEAIIYYGEDQYHWRPRFPNPKTNQVGMIFYHFVDKDHWYFSKGRDYLSEIVKQRDLHRAQFDNFDI